MQKEIAEEAKAEAQEFESITKTYEQNLATRKHFKPQFGEIYGGLGLTDRKFEASIRQWGVQQKNLLQQLKAPPETPLEKQSPIKLGHDLRGDSHKR